jgi:hypothetical protein
MQVGSDRAVAIVRFFEAAIKEGLIASAQNFHKAKKVLVPKLPEYSETILLQKLYSDARNEHTLNLVLAFADHKHVVEVVDVLEVIRKTHKI